MLIVSMDKQYSFGLNETGNYREPWQIFRIMSEFVEGYQFLSTLKKEVTILGSARFLPHQEYYKVAQELGALLGKSGYNTLTGGGPGIMEAANRGAFEVGGESIGLNIELPLEQKLSPYVKKSVSFSYFFTRKVMLTSPAHSFVFFPGGFGTLDEFFEVVDHMDIGKMSEVPVILVGKEYWEPLVAFLEDRCCAHGTTSHTRIQSWKIVETAEEAFALIQEHGKEANNCELSPARFHSGEYDVDWKVFRIMAELVQGFEFLTGLVEDVTVLGTKSMEPTNPFYEQAYQLGRSLGENGYAVVTGGATGVAEAANKGAMAVGGESIGIGMEVEGENRLNEFVNRSITFKFPFTRKLIVTAPSKAFVFFPGGFGTLHQLFEVLTLIQTGKMPRVPIILFGETYWQGVDDFIRNVLSERLQTINVEDTKLYTIVDSVEDSLTLINDFRGK